MQTTLSGRLQHPRRSMRGARRRFKQYRHNRQCEREMSRVEKLIPRLRDFTFGSGITDDEVERAYQKYVTNVSPAGMAISFQLTKLAWSVCRAVQPRRILDLGSGFSSYIFRRYASEAQCVPDVWSVDDDPAWLEKTRTFLKCRGLSTKNLVTWDEFYNDNPGSYDLILHDLGSLEVRSQTFEHVVSACAPGGVVILDDIQYYHMFPFPRLDTMASFHYCSLRALTVDRFGRYSALLKALPREESGLSGR